MFWPISITEVIAFYVFLPHWALVVSLGGSGAAGVFPPAGGAISTRFSAWAFWERQLKCQHCLLRQKDKGGVAERGREGVSKQPGSIKHVVLTESGEADCYSKFCMSGSLNESMTGISGAAWRSVPHCTRSTHPSQFPQHMCLNGNKSWFIIGVSKHCQSLLLIMIFFFLLLLAFSVFSSFLLSV